VNLLEKIYVDTAKILKAISEPKRLRIVDMLSCGELCACEILEEFHITQPTLSHDMKLLVETGMVQDRREGKNIYYSLNSNVLQELQETLKTIFTSNPDCICYSKSDGGCK
jgi:ArsR family transcriptional regulator